MATMRTVDQQTFVAFKRWMAAHAQNREPIKRRRDLLQAQIVQEVLDGRAGERGQYKLSAFLGYATPYRRTA